MLILGEGRKIELTCIQAAGRQVLLGRQGRVRCKGAVSCGLPTLLVKWPLSGAAAYPVQKELLPPWSKPEP